MSMSGEGPEKDVKQPEGDFTEFYIGIISKLYDLKCRQIVCDVRSALREIRAMKSEENRNKKLSYSYKTPPVKCAYLYGYSVLHSVMIYSEFLKYLGQNKRYMMRAVHAGSLKICCIGGGPGTEAVAVCKAINDFVYKSRAVSDKSLLEVKVTVVDKLPQWKREDAAVINAVNDETNILHSERVILHWDFLKADILKPFEKNLKEKIKEADIVTFIKVASYMQDDFQEDLQNMLRNIINCMDANSCLFMLENSGGSVFYNMRKVLAEWSGLSLLKKSDHIEYSLDQKTMRRLSCTMKYNNNSKYQPILPTGLGRVSSCLWIKNIFPVSENTQVSSNELDVNNVNSENSCCSSLQCDGNSVHDKSENCSKTERIAAKQTTVPKIRQKKKKLDSKKQKQPKDTDVLIISKTPTIKNIKVPSKELGVGNMKSKNSCASNLKCDGNSILKKRESDSKTEYIAANQATERKNHLKNKTLDLKKPGQPKAANVLIERYINCKTKKKNSTIRDLVGRTYEL